MDNLTTKEFSKKMMENLSKSKIIKIFVKNSAIFRIKNQPFFGLKLPKNSTGFVKFRRPIPFNKEDV